MDDIIYVNEKTGKVVPENYPDAVKYARVECRKTLLVGDVIVDEEGFMATVTDAGYAKEEHKMVFGVLNLVNPTTCDIEREKKDMGNVRVASEEEKLEYFCILKDLAKGRIG